MGLFCIGKQYYRLVKPRSGEIDGSGYRVGDVFIAELSAFEVEVMPKTGLLMQYLLENGYVEKITRGEACVATVSREGREF